MKLPAALFLTLTMSAFSADLDSRVKHGYADSNGVKVHYASLGSGPLVVMIHGFPDFWYTWRDQMEGLADHYQVVAMDQRGYNLSDKPEGLENYDMRLLVGDVAAVIRSLGKDKATIVGHDWGGAVAWQFAINVPQMTEKLIILNLPHMRGLSRELARPGSEQAKNSSYARNFQKEGSERLLTAEALSAWVVEPAAKQKYLEAFRRSSFAAMMAFYKRNYPREPYQEDTTPVVKVKAPVLQFHGLKDTYLLAGALDGTWNWVEKDYTLVTVPEAAHFVQHDASAFVTRTIRQWLDAR